MTALGTIVAALRPAADGAGHEVAIPDSWLQGRTCYGGLSAALALHCALRSEPDLPPLRSAQVAFVGPLAGTVRVATTRLRRGRNAAFVQADVSGDAGLGLRCTFVFMNALDSSVAFDAAPPCDVPPPHGGDRVLRGHPAVAFTGNFEMIDRDEGPDTGGWRRWLRLAERDGLHPLVELMAIGDALPPAAARRLRGPAPLSSLTWTMNLLEPAPTTSDGWWLLRSDTERASDGHSSQTMAIWNRAGRKVAEQTQAVAIFG